MLLGYRTVRSGDLKLKVISETHRCYTARVTSRGNPHYPTGTILEIPKRSSFVYYR